MSKRDKIDLRKEELLSYELSNILSITQDKVFRFLSACYSSLV